MNIEPSPLTKVACDLTEILDLHQALLEQAVHQARARIDGTSLPGGEAMIALAPVANHEAWENMQQASEHTGRPLTAPELEDDNQTPLQLVCFWAERWRREHGAEYGQTPTIWTEVNFIRWNLEWAITHEPQWSRFTDDIATARSKLENILHDGRRDIVSDDVTCLLCGTPLRRRMTEQEGYEDEWWCRDCRAHLTGAQFNLAASESARRQLGLS